MNVIISDPQSVTRDCYASAPDLNLTLRSNGEEKVTIIGPYGDVLQAGLPAPTVAPVVSGNGAGSLTNGRFVAYAYVYASSKYPSVDGTAINGLLYPRSNPSPISAVWTITNPVTALSIEVTKTTRSDVSEIWVFRTQELTTSLLASTAAAAGQMFFIGSVTNDGTSGTTSFADAGGQALTDQIENDNFSAPLFKYCVYDGIYFWGIGNDTLEQAITLTNNSGAISFTSGNLYDGRDGQIAILQGITDGGIDGRGAFYFKVTSANTAQLYLDAALSIAPTSLPSGTTTISVSGPSSTLYRSKAHNPFSWGRTLVFGTSNVPEIFALKVCGGTACAMAITPNGAILKLDFQNPNACYSYNLNLATSDSFTNTRRLISSNYVVTSHWSQFVALTPERNLVLWGIDQNNFAILQCDGVNQVPVSDPVFQQLRNISTDAQDVHGIYDSNCELNCMWVKEDGFTNINKLIYQHAPSGQWGICNENDVSASGQIEHATFVGTDTGLLGQAFDKTQSAPSNWLNGLVFFQIRNSVANGTTTTFDTAFPHEGAVGNWMYVVGSTTLQAQMARVSALVGSTYHFDLFYNLETKVFTPTFSPVPDSTFVYWLGIIYCSLERHFDLGEPSSDKQMTEIWITAFNALWIFGRFRENYNTQPAIDFSFNTDNKSLYQRGTIPSVHTKAFSIKIIDYGIAPIEICNIVMKPQLNE